MAKTVSMAKKKAEKAAKAILANIDRFPYLKNVKDTIGKLKEYNELLEKRKVFAKEGYNDLSPKEQNDVDILIIETDMRISKNRRNIDERTEYFNSYHDELVNIYDEVLEKNDSIRKEAIMKAKDKKFHNAKALKDELEVGNDSAAKFQTNWELKIRHYLELKKLLTASPAAKDKELTDVEVTHS